MYPTAHLDISGKKLMNIDHSTNPNFTSRSPEKDSQKMYQFQEFSIVQTFE